MYLPSHFEEHRPAVLHALVADHPFGLLVTQSLHAGLSANPIPWLLDSPDALETATPLPGTAYKVEIARALIPRALAAL